MNTRPCPHNVTTGERFPAHAIHADAGSRIILIDGIVGRVAQ